MKFSDSLKKTEDFQNVYSNGRSYADKNFVVYALKNDTPDFNRLGISISKKVGNSVVRHRLTRLIRESYRLHEEIFISGMDIVVIARVGTKDIDFHEVEKSFLKLTNLHKLTK